MTDYNDILHLSRPKLHHIPMDVRQRAKQFAPFAALKGFEECIHEKEDFTVPGELERIEVEEEI